MKKEELLIQGETLEASQTGMLEVEMFLHENYMFRRNVLNGKVEFANKPQNGLETIWKMLTQGAINSIMVMCHIIKSFLSRLLEGGMREV